MRIYREPVWAAGIAVQWKRTIGVAGKSKKQRKGRECESLWTLWENRRLLVLRGKI